jgi:hypothetical protein
MATKTKTLGKKTQPAPPPPNSVVVGDGEAVLTVDGSEHTLTPAEVAELRKALDAAHIELN